MICRWRHGAGASMRKVAYEGFSVKVRHSPPVSLVLTGFMGVGKTTVGGILAKRGHLHWLDTDQLLEERHGCAVTTLFVQVGESDFRECEAEICRELAEQEGLLITTGGGTLLQPETAALFARRALVICLTAREDTIARRLPPADPSRPLFSQDWRKLLAERQPRYLAFRHQVVTDDRCAQQVADEIWALWQQAQRPG